MDNKNNSGKRGCDTKTYPVISGAHVRKRTQPLPDKKKMLPAISGFGSDMFYGKVNAWIKLKDKGLGELYEKENGKLIKRGTIIFSPLLPRFHNAYLILKDKSARLPPRTQVTRYPPRQTRVDVYTMNHVARRCR
jgi:hypothetical protein